MSSVSLAMATAALEECSILNPMSWMFLGISAASPNENRETLNVYVARTAQLADADHVRECFVGIDTLTWT